MSKQVQTTMGEVSINTPRDRDGTFDPKVVRKREKFLADSLADRIIGLYAIGNSTREISDILEEQFGNRISAETISSITDRVLPEIQSWKNRPLDRVYPIVWLDAVHYKVICIVHQIRNSVKYVASKNQKEFMRDLKLVYQAVNKDAAEKALDDLEIKWGRTIRWSSRAGVTTGIV